MLGAILNWLSGGVASALVDAYKAKLEADNSAAKVDAGLAAQDIAARQSIVVAEIGSRLLQWPRFVIEVSVALYVCKVVLADKIIAPAFGFNWSTDAITGPVGVWVGVVIGGMFGASIADRITSKLTGR